MRSETFTSNSEEETFALGHRLAGGLAAGDVVALAGDLGTGKTHLVKGMAGAFGIDKARVHSPTFSLIHEYGGTPPLYHFDCYRMESLHEALETGMEEYLYGQGVCVIEWPDLVEQILPDSHIRIEIEATSKNSRRFTILKP